MATSPKMNWPVPSENQDPWYDDFISMIEATDASAFAAREDRNIVLMGGGIFSFTASTGVLSWAGTIYIFSPLTGFVCTIVPGSITLLDSQVFYVNVVRGTLDNATVSSLKDYKVPTTDQAFLIGIRNGSKIYFRTGAVLNDGAAVAVFESPGGSGGGGGFLTQTIAVGLNEATPELIYQSIGNFPLDPSVYDVEGYTIVIRFLTVCLVTSGTFTGSVELYDLTDDVTIQTHSYSEMVPTRKKTTLFLSPGEHMYEVRMKCVGSPGIGDMFVCKWAGFEIGVPSGPG